MIVPSKRTTYLLFRKIGEVGIDSYKKALDKALLEGVLSNKEPNDITSRWIILRIYIIAKAIKEQEKTPKGKELVTGLIREILDE